MHTGTPALTADGQSASARRGQDRRMVRARLHASYQAKTCRAAIGVSALVDAYPCIVCVNRHCSAEFDTARHGAYPLAPWEINPTGGRSSFKDPFSAFSSA